jgi:hypothetical protein
MRGRLFIAMVVGLLLARCGSVISGDVTGDKQPFDFEHPRCIASITNPAAGVVDVRYLGSGGVYLGWGSDAILLGPFFSNPSLIHSQLCSMHHDRSRIREHLASVPVQNVRAILTGHSHYDHVADVPVVAQEYATGAQIYVNETGLRMLAAYRHLRNRTHLVNAGDVISITTTNGAEVMRIRAVASDHAPQVCRSRRWPCNISDCRLKAEWTTPFESHRLRNFCSGQTLAYVIDLLGDRTVRYRIYYNDASPESPLGDPPRIDSLPYDLAILCMSSYDMVHGYPESVIGAIHPAHVVIAHYEDFFSRTDDHWHFVPLLRDRKALRFIQRMRSATTTLAFQPPIKSVCGASAPDFTMPVVGEQMLFRPMR